MVATAVYSVTMVFCGKKPHGKALEKECCLPGVFCDSDDTPTSLSSRVSSMAISCHVYQLSLLSSRFLSFSRFVDYRVIHLLTHFAPHFCVGSLPADEHARMPVSILYLAVLFMTARDGCGRCRLFVMRMHGGASN